MIAFGPHTSQRASRWAFFGVMALVFAACVALTVIACRSMHAMGDRPMPGGWSVSMTWTPMCGQKWPRAAATFAGMWIVMMIAMMLPSLAPVLWRYHEAIGTARAHRLTALVGIGYFCVSAVLGALVFACGFALIALALRLPWFARAMPVASSAVVLLAGLSQFSAWKLRHLASSRVVPVHAAAPTDAWTAWMRGLRVGVHGVSCCAGLTAVLVVNGMMDLRTMSLVTLAMTLERVTPRPGRVAHGTGWIVIATGGWMLVRALAFN
jgi:predicted metal-binding membrane protein